MSQIKICDWCKKQIRGRGQRGSLKLTDKKGTSKKSQKTTDKSVATSIEYDLCNACYGEIDARLQSSMPHPLDKMAPLVQTPIKDMSSKTDINMSREEWIAQVEDEKITPKKESTNVATPKRGKTTATKKEGVIDPRETNTECPHYNKSKIVIPTDEVSRPYQRCRDCGERIAYSRKEADMRLDSGVTFHDKN